jgi:hypothetical protein
LGEHGGNFTTETQRHEGKKGNGIGFRRAALSSLSD